ncbi:MAG: hypothetical protein AB1553_02070 [Nitrospirota bacterium]
MAKKSMWTISMTRCTTCPLKDDCPDRAEILRTLSVLTNKMHLDRTTEGGAAGTIIVNCGA